MGGRMEGADESTELWRHPNLISTQNCKIDVIVFNIFTAKRGFQRGETKKRQIPFLISN